MKEKRRNTPWRDFVKEICSWTTIVLRKIDGKISNIPQSWRISPKRVSTENFMSENNTSFGLEYDFFKDFFHNCHVLYNIAPMPYILQMGGCENADYNDNVVWIKNAYLTFHSGFCENALYSIQTKENSNNVLNSMMVRANSENVYMSTGVITGYNIFYSKYIKNCSDIRCSDNLLDCQECLFCSHLERKKYHINNKEYPREEYQKLKKQLLQDKESFLRFYQNLKENGENLGSTEVNNSRFALDCTNISNAQYCLRITNGRNLILFGSHEDNQDEYDQFSGGSRWWRDLYGGRMVGAWSQNVYCSYTIVSSMNMYYCFGCMSCSYCLGCVGLKNKSFCILNKEYSKEERFEKANEIFAQMDKDWILWKFFPWWMNPFYFNDTFAYLIDDSFTEEEVAAEGYLWRDEEIKVDVPSGAEVITTQQLNDYQWFDVEWNRKINPEILKKVIKDEKGNFYRIVPMELEFLQKHELPLPEIHWLERMKLGFKFK